MRPKRLEEVVVVLAALGAIGIGCGGRDEKSRSEDGGGPIATPRPDAGRGTERTKLDAGTPRPVPSDAGTIDVPAAPAPEGARPEPPRTERLIGSLTPEELQRLCQDGRKEVARAIVLQAEMQCTATAIALTNSPEQCRAQRSACLSQSPASPLTEDTCAIDAPALAEDCAEVSVADVRACSEAWTKKLEVAATQIDCSMAGSPREAPPVDVPEECQNIDARCAH